MVPFWDHSKLNNRNLAFWQISQHISLKGGYAMSTFDFSPMLRYSVGFDRMQRQLNLESARTEATYPPYNIETDGDDAYRITLAVAGFDKKDINITLEDDKLNINSLLNYPVSLSGMRNK